MIGKNKTLELRNTYICIKNIDIFELLLALLLIMNSFIFYAVTLTTGLLCLVLFFQSVIFFPISDNAFLLKEKLTQILSYTMRHCLKNVLKSYCNASKKSLKSAVTPYYSFLNMKMTLAPKLWTVLLDGPILRRHSPFPKSV